MLERQEAHFLFQLFYSLKLTFCISYSSAPDDVFQMCERCNRHTECTKRLSIQRFPQVIVIRILGNTTLPCVLALLASDLFLLHVMLMLNSRLQI